MALPGIHTGTLPPFTYVPGEGPRGVLPARNLREPAIPAPYGRERTWGTHPPVPVGQGYLSRIRRKVARMDVVNGMDRTLGKTRTIRQGRKTAQQSKNLGNLSTHHALGRLSGATGHMFSAYF